MREVIDGFALIFTSFINFLFSLKFSDGTSAGGILLAVCVMSLLIRFLFRQIQAGGSSAFSLVVDEKKQRNAAAAGFYNSMVRGD